ncbi:MAG: Crp/Fnr family transcriptional regulator [Sphingobacteriaceae bacterium]|nr:Crp/Fnr family transcriptional regulator [Sphingobacteriaceae bacterium]
MFQIDKYHLKSSQLFNALTDKELKALKEKQLIKDYAKGEIIFKEKSNPKGIYFVLKGKVKIFQTNQEAKQSIVYIYKKNDVFGYRPILAGEQHPVGAMALEKAEVAYIPKEHFLLLLDQSNILAQNLVLLLAEEFSVWVNRMTIFSQCSVKERMALTLLILEKVFQTDLKQKKTVINFNRDDFAAYVGTAKENLVRTLRVFKDEKLISTKGSKIIILNRVKLEEMIKHI